MGRQTATPAHGLRRVVGVTFGIAAVIGGTIGGGILRTPGTIAGLLHDPSVILLVWLACGVLVLISANSMAELAAAVPRAGGPYEYCKLAFGRFGGFAIGWSDWLTNVCALAFLSVAAAEFTETLFGLPATWTPLLAVSVLALIALLNWFGLELGSRVQQALSLAKVIGLGAIVVACFVHAAGSGHHELAAPPPAGTAASAAAIALLFAVVRSMQLMYETYQGWNSGVYFAEEDRDSARNVPRAMFTGIFVVIALYMLVNLAVLAVVPMPQLAASRLAVADAAGIVFGPGAERTVTVLALVSLLGILNITAMFTPRVLFALGRDGLSLPGAAHINAHGVPGVATLLSLAISAAMAAAGTFEALFEITGTIGMLVNSAAMFAFFRLRRTHPDLARPYRAKGHPWLPAIALATTLALLIAIGFANPLTTAAAFGLLGASYPAWRWIDRRLGGLKPARPDG